MWLSFAIFSYHFALIKKYQKPEDKFYVNNQFLEMAKFVDWSFYDLKTLLTKPAMTKMLPDRMQLPNI